MNLLSGSSLHQKILSVGKDPMIEENKANDPGGGGGGGFYNVNAIHAELYGGPEVTEEKQAFTFSVVQKHGRDEQDSDSRPLSQTGTPLKDASGFHPSLGSGKKSKQQIQTEIRMASVCYVHSASFLEELNSCATDFKVRIKCCQ